MNGKRKDRQSGSAWKDLMITSPNAGTAAIDEMKDAIERLGETVSAQAGRPDPVTREELETWGARVLERVAEAASGRADPMTREEIEEANAGLAGRILAATAPDRDPDGRTGDEAEDDRLVREQLRFIVHLLMWKGAPIRQDLERIRRTANGIDAGWAHAREAQDEDFVAVSQRLDAIERGIGELRGSLGIPFHWIVLGMVAGMAMESWSGYAAWFFRWLGI